MGIKMIKVMVSVSSEKKVGGKTTMRTRVQARFLPAIEEGDSIALLARGDGGLRAYLQDNGLTVTKAGRAFLEGTLGISPWVLGEGGEIPPGALEALQDSLPGHHKILTGEEAVASSKKKSREEALRASIRAQMAEGREGRRGAAEPSVVPQAPQVPVAELMKLLAEAKSFKGLREGMAALLLTGTEG
jgi:hypothetical protein